tara:strand:- start:888 stop:2894 length:2007 start_codon:yes stop_codon:yes gene_type:complete
MEREIDDRRRSVTPTKPVVPIELGGIGGNDLSSAPISAGPSAGVLRSPVPTALPTKLGILPQEEAPPLWTLENEADRRKKLDDKWGRQDWDRVQWDRFDFSNPEHREAFDYYMDDYDDPNKSVGQRYSTGQIAASDAEEKWAADKGTLKLKKNTLAANEAGGLKRELSITEAGRLPPIEIRRAYQRGINNATTGTWVSEANARGALGGTTWFDTAAGPNVMRRRASIIGELAQQLLEGQITSSNPALLGIDPTNLGLRGQRFPQFTIGGDEGTGPGSQSANEQYTDSLYVDYTNFRQQAGEPQTTTQTPGGLAYPPTTQTPGGLAYPLDPNGGTSMATPSSIAVGYENAREDINPYLGTYEQWKASGWNSLQDWINAGRPQPDEILSVAPDTTQRIGDTFRPQVLGDKPPTPTGRVSWGQPTTVLTEKQEVDRGQGEFINPGTWTQPGSARLGIPLGIPIGNPPTATPYPTSEPEDTILTGGLQEPQRFEDIFRGIGRRALASRFLEGLVPQGQARGVYRDVLENYRGGLTDAFTINRVLGGPTRFEDFLSRYGQGSIPRISGEQLSTLGEYIGTDPLAPLGPGGKPLSDAQRDLINALRDPTQGQTEQFNILMGQRQRDLPWDLRSGFGDLARQRFDQIIGANIEGSGTPGDFQLIPHVLEQGGFFR